MRLGTGDELLSMQVGTDDEQAVMVVTNGGFGKRTKVGMYPRQGRGGKGVLTAKIEHKRGQLVSAVIVADSDELYAVTSTGVVIRMSIDSLRFLSRATGGVKLISLAAGSSVVAVARSSEADGDDDEDGPASPEPDDDGARQ